MKRQPRPKTQDNLRNNLTALLEARDWSNKDLARESRVSDRHIGMILNGERKPTIDVAEKLAKAFGLPGWQLIRPNLRADLIGVENLKHLIDNYESADKQGREHIEGAAALVARLRKPSKGP